jgi:hypothetical protein
MENYMKKLIFVMIIACLAVGTVFAQWGAPAQAVTVSGTLQLQNGAIAVSSGSNVYFVPVLNRYIGFIEGLREGAQVSINGFVWGNSLQPNTVTIEGKTYDFAANAPGGGYGMGGGYGYCGNYSGGGWGHHGGGNGRRGMGRW